MKISKKLLPLILSGILTSAYAVQPIPRGVYVGGGVGYGQTYLARPASASSFDREGATWRLLVSYQLDPMIAVEVGLMNMANVKAGAWISGMNVTDEVEPYFAYLALKGSTNIQDSIDLFAKIGVAYAHGRENLKVDGTLIETASEHKFTGYSALGASYNVTSEVSLDVELATTFKQDNIPRMTVGSVGVIFRFPQNA